MAKTLSKMKAALVNARVRARRRASAGDPDEIITEETVTEALAPTPELPSEEAIVTQNSEMDQPILSEVTGRSATILGQDLQIFEIFPGLLCPQTWTDEALTHSCMSFVRDFISRLSPPALSTPWIITSMTKDLTGQERVDSDEHLKGRAVDLAPMYSEDVILPEDPIMLGLGWNIKSLILLSETQWGDLPMFIEGDHVHIGEAITPSEVGTLPIMWSDSDAYQSVVLSRQDKLLTKLRNSFWRWSSSTMRLEGANSEVFSWCQNLLKHDN